MSHRDVKQLASRHGQGQGRAHGNQLPLLLPLPLPDCPPAELARQVIRKDISQRTAYRGKASFTALDPASSRILLAPGHDRRHSVAELTKLISLPKMCN